MDRAFENARAAALRRLAEARAAGQADLLAQAACDALNARPAWFTSSSCSGRVQVLALEAPGRKAGAGVLGRWHAAPSPEEVAMAVARRPAGRTAHLFVEPPILHAVARDLDRAVALLRLAHRAGFKASHVRSIASGGRATVEVADAARIAAPVSGPAGEAPQAFLRLLAAEAPALLARGHARLQTLVALLGAAPLASAPAASPVPAVQEPAERG